MVGRPAVTVAVPGVATITAGESLRSSERLLLYGTVWSCAGGSGCAERGQLWAPEPDTQRSSEEEPHGVLAVHTEPSPARHHYGRGVLPAT